MSLLQIDQKKGDIVNNFRSVSLLNLDCKCLIKVLEKRMVFVVERFDGDTQTCVIPTRTIHKLQFTQYIIETIINISSTPLYRTPLYVSNYVL